MITCLPILTASSQGLCLSFRLPTGEMRKYVLILANCVNASFHSHQYVYIEWVSLHWQVWVLPQIFRYSEIMKLLYELILIIHQCNYHSQPRLCHWRAELDYYTHDHLTISGSVDIQISTSPFLCYSTNISRNSILVFNVCTCFLVKWSVYWD